MTVTGSAGSPELPDVGRVEVVGQLVDSSALLFRIGWVRPGVGRRWHVEVRDGLLSPATVIETAEFATKKERDDFLKGCDLIRYALPDLRPGTWIVNNMDGSGLVLAAVKGEVASGHAEFTGQWEACIFLGHPRGTAHLRFNDALDVLDFCASFVDHELPWRYTADGGMHDRSFDVECSGRSDTVKWIEIYRTRGDRWSGRLWDVDGSTFPLRVGTSTETVELLESLCLCKMPLSRAHTPRIG